MGKDKFSVFMANLAMLLALESYSPEKIDQDMEMIDSLRFEVVNID